MTESLPNYDRWKLDTPASYDDVEKHPLDLSDKEGEVVSFWWKHPKLKTLISIFGRVFKADSEGVWIDFIGQKTYYAYDDMRAYGSEEDE